jgi:SAM-dependent methyltransferase
MKQACDYQRLLDPGGHQTLYQPLEHPAFRDWTAQQPCKERWRLIQSVDLPSTGLCIDLGCHTGWFCRQFSRIGWRTLGVDTKSLEIEIARDLMSPFNGPISPEYALGDIVDAVLPPADVALCLSVVMYLFNPQFGKTQRQAWGALQKISEVSPRMFLDYGGMYCTVPASFPDDVLARTDYTRCQLLGRTDLESRPFYLFTRD